MQDEVSDRVVGLLITGSRITAQSLKQAFEKFVFQAEKTKKATEQKLEKKVNEKKTGKQSLQTLMDQGANLVNVEITDNNIKDFEKVARKYMIDYSLVKDKSQEEPKYYVFFKARDEAVMLAAFKEYAGIEEPDESKYKDEPSKDSIREKLEINKELVKGNDPKKQLTVERIKTRNRPIDPSR